MPRDELDGEIHDIRSVSIDTFNIKDFLSKEYNDDRCYYDGVYSKKKINFNQIEESEDGFHFVKRKITNYGTYMFLDTKNRDILKNMIQTSGYTLNSVSTNDYFCC